VPVVLASRYLPRSTITVLAAKYKALVQAFALGASDVAHRDCPCLTCSLWLAVVVLQKELGHSPQGIGTDRTKISQPSKVLEDSSGCRRTIDDRSETTAPPNGLMRFVVAKLVHFARRS